VANDLSVVSDGLDRATAHRLVTKRLFVIVLGLFENERIVVFVATREILRRRIATDVAIDARRVDVIRTTHVFFNFIVLVRHARFALGMRHLFRDHQPVKLFSGQVTKLHGRFAQADLPLVSVFSNLGSFVVTDVRIQCGYQH